MSSGGSARRIIVRIVVVTADGLTTKLHSAETENQRTSSKALILEVNGQFLGPYFRVLAVRTLLV